MRDEANEEQGHHKKSNNNSTINIPMLELSNLQKPIQSPSKQPMPVPGELSSIRYQDIEAYVVGPLETKKSSRRHLLASATVSERRLKDYLSQVHQAQPGPDVTSHNTQQ